MLNLKNKSRALSQKAVACLLIVLMLLSTLPFMALAQASPKFYSTKTESSEEALFECNSSAGWTGYRTAKHWTVGDNGEEITAYCLQHKYTPPKGGEDYHVVNGSDYYNTETLIGLQIIASYGYPNSTGGFSAHEAEYATCSAIRWWLAEQEDAGKISDPDSHYNYDNLKNGNVRPKAGNENLFNWAVSLVEKARGQVEMEHKVTLNPKSLELKDDGKGNYSGSVTVSLTNCNGGYKVPSGTIKAIEALGGCISGTAGGNGGKITVTVPKGGNANKTIPLSVIGIDNRVPGNFIFAEPNRNDFPQTGESGSSRQRMFAVFETWDNAADSSATLTTPKNSLASIIKVDAETGKVPQGDATLDGAEFKIVAAADILGTNLKAGDTAIGNLKAGEKVELFPGKYKIYETKVPNGYVLNKQPKDITIAEAGREYTFDFEDNVIKRPIAIVKFLGENISKPAEGNVPQIPEANAEFQVILKSSGKVVTTIKTDERGYGETEPLSYGTYTVHQTKGTEGHMFLDDIDIVINENMPDKPYLLIVDNYAERMPLRIIKIDAETGEKVATAGAKFKIKDSKGTYVSQTIYYPQTQTITEWVTDATGTVQLPNTLPYGTYSIVELEAPEGYVINNNEIKFKVSKANASKEDPLFVEVKVSDMPIKGKIQINKTGLQFIGVASSETEYKETLFTPVFENRLLAGAVYDIVAVNDIVVNGDIKVAAGEVADTVTTNGVQSKELYLGTYKLIERQAPEGYVLSDEETEVVIESQGQNIPLVNIKVEVGNEYQNTAVSIYKEAEVIVSKETDDKIMTEIERVPGAGFVFGLYAAQDFYAANDSKNAAISDGSLVAVGTTDQNGTLVFDGKLPHGKYIVREIHTNKDYEENLTEYPVDISYNADLDKIEVNLTEEPILNKIVKIPVTITKHDITGEKTIPGTTIEVLNENGEVIFRDVTKDDGTLSDILVENGHKYTFREVLSAEGYALNTAVMNFEVTEDGQIIGDTSIKDEYSKYELLKTDENGNPLQGCEFGLFDMNDNLVMSATSDKNGIVRFERLPFGKYTIKEIKAAEGYQLSDRVIVIEVTGKWINSNTSVDFENVPEIKTGINDSQWMVPAAIATALLIMVGTVTICIVKKRKHK